MLSVRARKYLETLERRPAVATTAVEAAIRAQGYPCFEPWLEFHERYAGYVEWFGRDGAIWGVIHEKPQWLLPLRADIEKETHEDTWYVTCADAHPSYNYRLDSAGEFIGVAAQSFDIHVERIALGWEFNQRTGGRDRPLTAGDLRGPEFSDLAERISASLVPEASDRYFRYYMSDTQLLVQDAVTGVLKRGRMLNHASLT